MATTQQAMATGSRSASGLGFAALSAMSFGLSGALAKGLLDAGWTPGAAVAVRILVAAAVLVVPAALALRGRWGLLRPNAGLVLAYGLVAVAGCQLAYFNAVEHMQVGVALLIEYTAPVAVVGWLWLRHGQRPGPLTVVGGAVAAAGLVLVLDLVSGADLSALGVLWALGAMVGAATYFVLSAHEGNGLPPIVLAAAGLVLGATALLVAGAVGVVPMHVSAARVEYAGTEVAWWVPVLGLGVVTAALAYVTGIAASRRLGSRLASFAALLEVLFALVFAWLLLDELPRGIQFLGGALVLTGVVVVKLGEREVAPAPPVEPLV
ncbi:drug/metabolite transporter (DMT)-like permease [Nocardioides ginsengisegetis]|uniref:Drug/metabolite transporter (DMT)-like permease n=1 Tax=Nocardioides ginsengisegetis TaxID=661491 RepID=A0A7W3IY56_9ACTN|nr:DMT family transporter [Nocardioides ginsengisegetis]MBA8802659.1 drug/metabolite transporter (DMT)-like permease [Nocardioides ginsengisegetis]